MESMVRGPTKHDVVRFLAASGQWPAGTTGTVVQASDKIALVEIADDHGRTLDFVSLPQQQLAVESEQTSSVPS